MSEVKRAITDAMRQRIYEMWISGYKVANIAADIGVNAHTVKSELERGYTGDIYIGGRKVYDPDRASAIAKMVKAGRPPVRIVPPVVLGKEPIMTDTRVICSACAAKFLRRFQSVASKTN